MVAMADEAAMDMAATDAALRVEAEATDMTEGVATHSAVVAKATWGGEDTVMAMAMDMHIAAVVGAARDMDMSEAAEDMALTATATATAMAADGVVTATVMATESRAW